MKCLNSLVFIAMSFMVYAQDEIPKIFEQWEPKPAIIDPGTNTQAPSDAIVLFDGTDLSMFVNAQGEVSGWTVENGIVTVKAGDGPIISKDSFGDCQLHVEWRAPAIVEGNGQGRGNSGIFLQSRYEVQVLDNYENETYPNGQAASIYKQHIPLVNACRPPGEWQTYDIIFTAPTFDAKGYRSSAGMVTVLHNGILVQHNSVIYGTTEYDKMPQNLPHGEAPIMIQDHDNPVSFRNIWVRRL